MDKFTYGNSLKIKDVRLCGRSDPEQHKGTRNPSGKKQRAQRNSEKPKSKDLTDREILLGTEWQTPQRFPLLCFVLFAPGKPHLQLPLHILLFGFFFTHREFACCTQHTPSTDNTEPLKEVFVELGSSQAG